MADTVRVIFEHATGKHVAYCSDHGRVGQSEDPDEARRLAEAHVVVTHGDAPEVRRDGVG